MNKTAVAVTGVITVACLIGLNIWQTNNRELPFSEFRKIAAENYVDRDLPAWASNRLTRVSLDSLFGTNGEMLKGGFYNGSDWYITRVIVSVSMKEEGDGKTLVRDYSAAVTSKPLTIGTFSVAIGSGKFKALGWEIKKAFGRKE